MQKGGFLLLLSVFLVGCAASDTIVDEGDVVDFDYTLTLDDGTLIDTSGEKIAKQEGIFDPSRAYGPATETVGRSQLSKAVENEMIGMQYLQTRRIRLSPEDAFGQRINDSDITFLKSQIEGELKIKGLVYVLDEKGVKTPYYITKINGDEVSVNRNHPYAGLFVTHEITIQWIEAG